MSTRTKKTVIAIALAVVTGLGCLVVMKSAQTLPAGNVSPQSQLASRLNHSIRAQTESIVTTGDTAMPEEADEFAIIEKSDEQWRRQLTPEQYHVTRKQGTERQFTGPNWDNKASGVYSCVCCGLPLFRAETKYESGTGWPSFWDPIKQTSVETQDDVSLFARRTEVHCRRCKAHLGHVFEDGPDPTGLRYCMNGVAMRFEPSEKSTDQAAKTGEEQ